MYTKTIIIKNPEGLHARPATRFVSCAKTWKSTISLTKDGKTANAKSMIDILTLVAGKDSEVCISADGPDETAAVTALADLLSGSENK